MAKTAKKTTSKISKVKPLQLKIKRVNPDNVRSVPINDLVINHTETEFFITFSSLEPPTILDKEDLKGLSDVSAITRAKFVVSPKFVETAIKALTENLEKYHQRVKK